MKAIIILLAAVLFGAWTTDAAFAQDNEFRQAVSVIMRDAPNHFVNIRGKEKSNSVFAITWESGVRVPGTVASRFVYNKGLYYEGALVQVTDTILIRPVYNAYAAKLDSMLLPLGYERSDFDNFYPGLATFPKITYLPVSPEKSAEKPSHLALEVTHSKELNAYTVVLFIYEH